MMTMTKTVPGPKRRPVIGYLPELRKQPMHFLHGLARQYGPVVRFNVGSFDFYLVDEPDYIREVLVTSNRSFVKGRALEYAKRVLGNGLLTSEGEFHKRQRRLAQPAFHKQRINSYGDVMADYAARMRSRWSPGATLDMHEEMMHLTLAIVAKTLFDADVESEASQIGEALDTAMVMFRRVTLPFAEHLDRLPLPSNRRFQRARKRLDETIYRIIAERRAGGVDRGDLLSMLLMAQDVEGDGGSMTDEQLRDEAMTLFLAGHETTANALTWTWYLLSRHPEVERKLHEEIDAVLQGRLPTVEDLSRLEYTEMVLTESMRVFPPAWTVSRRAIEPVMLGEYEIPADATVMLSQYVTHHNPRFYEDPFRFDPERWRPEARSARPKFAYFPFGGGPRICIGEAFAWMEGVLLIATLAQQWKMRMVPGHPVETQPLITLRPKHGMRMTVERR